MVQATRRPLKRSRYVDDLYRVKYLDLNNFMFVKTSHPASRV